jgi:RimJ/RimL family protein N-acetyltransferase
MSIDIIPPIYTPRLMLRMTSRSDAAYFFQLNSDPEVLRYTGDLPFESVDAAAAFLESYDQYPKYRVGRLAVLWRDSNELLGWCGLKYHPDTGETDIGYRLMRSCWGKGIATEAAEAAIQDGVARLGLKRVIANVHVHNAASFRVCAKLGMSPCSEYAWGGANWKVLEKFL